MSYALISTSVPTSRMLKSPPTSPSLVRQNPQRTFRGYASGFDFACGLVDVFLSILRECSSLMPHLRTIEAIARQHRFSTTYRHLFVT